MICFSRQNKSMQDPGTPQRPPRPDMNERPPRPATPGGGVHSGNEQTPGKEAKQNRRRGKQVMPTLIMLGLITGAFLLYSGIRAARESLTKPTMPNTTLPQQLGGIQLGLPSGWHQAQMGGVSKSSGRWGMGKPGSTHYAFFITRYPLSRTPESDKQKRQVLAEAQRSLLATGAAGKKLRAQDYKQSEANGWKYHFRTGGIDVQIWLLIHTKENRAALYQFACQSQPGGKGQQMRENCKGSLDQLKFDPDIA